jgi:uncharacterized membrane protein
MLTMLVVAFALGVVAGLRTFTAPAVLLLARHVRVAGGIVAVLAVGELVADLLPNTPSRTTPMPLAARIVSGAFVGWFATSGTALIRVAGAVAGIIGALVGTFGGHGLRLKAITWIGAIPAGLLEDVVAIGIAVAAVTVSR